MMMLISRLIDQLWTVIDISFRHLDYDFYICIYILFIFIIIIIIIIIMIFFYYFKFRLAHRLRYAPCNAF